jgi:hypothetical protein
LLQPIDPGPGQEDRHDVALLAPHAYAEPREIRRARVGEHEARKPRLPQVDWRGRLACRSRKVDARCQRRKQAIARRPVLGGAPASIVGRRAALGQNLIFDSLELGGLPLPQLEELVGPE